MFSKVTAVVIAFNVVGCMVGLKGLSKPSASGTTGAVPSIYTNNYDAAWAKCLSRHAGRVTTNAAGVRRARSWLINGGAILTAVLGAALMFEAGVRADTNPPSDFQLYVGASSAVAAALLPLTGLVATATEPDFRELIEKKGVLDEHLRTLERAATSGATLPAADAAALSKSIEEAGKEVKSKIEHRYGGGYSEIALDPCVRDLLRSADESVDAEKVKKLRIDFEKGIRAFDLRGPPMP